MLKNSDYIAGEKKSHKNPSHKNSYKKHQQSHKKHTFEKPKKGQLKLSAKKHYHPPTGEYLPYSYDIPIDQNNTSLIFDAATRSKTNETSFYILQTEKVTRNRKL